VKNSIPTSTPDATSCGTTQLMWGCLRAVFGARRAILSAAGNRIGSVLCVCVCACACVVACARVCVCVCVCACIVMPMGRGQAGWVHPPRAGQGLRVHMACAHAPRTCLPHTPVRGRPPASADLAQPIPELGPAGCRVVRRQQAPAHGKVGVGEAQCVSCVMAGVRWARAGA